MGKKNAKNNNGVDPKPSETIVEEVEEVPKEKTNKKNNGSPLKTSNLKDSPTNSPKDSSTNTPKDNSKELLRTTLRSMSSANLKDSSNPGLSGLRSSIRQASSTNLKASVDLLRKVQKTSERPVHKQDKWGQFFSEMIARVITVAVALWAVTRAPIPAEDFQKPVNYSFFSSYLEGRMDHVEFVTQIIIAAAASVLFDFFVIFYHVTNPPHPKFVLATVRKISIYLHLVAGIVEITTGLLAFLITDHELQQGCVLAMSIVSIIHAITAYYQVTVVFGAKGIMVPGYLYAITIHIVSAFRLYQLPTSFVFLYSTYLTLHIYVWCRFFVFMFRYFNTFQHYHYTIAITLSGALLFPYTMGPVGNFGFLFIGTLYCVLHWLVNKGEDLAHLLFSEHERYALISSKILEEWKDVLVSASGAEELDKHRAREVFEQYDLDNDSKLSMVEVYNLVKLLGIPSNNIAKIVADIDESGDSAVDFDEFYRYVWNYGSIKDRLVKCPHLEQHKLTEQEQAHLVFEMLDVDDSGYISKAELSVLLSQWGMPCYEADVYLASYFENGKQLDKQTFVTHMRPIWRFAAREVFQA